MFRHIPEGHMHQRLRNSGFASLCDGSSVATYGPACQQTGKQEMAMPLL